MMKEHKEEKDKKKHVENTHGTTRFKLDPQKGTTETMNKEQSKETYNQCNFTKEMRNLRIDKLHIHDTQKIQKGNDETAKSHFYEILDDTFGKNKQNNEDNKNEEVKNCLMNYEITPDASYEDTINKEGMNIWVADTGATCHI